LRIEVENINIRPIETRDKDAVIDITVKAWSSIYNGYRKQMGDDIYELFYSNWQAIKIESINDIITNNNKYYYVAVYNRITIGYCGYEMNETHNIATIGMNAVSIEYRNNGIGSYMNMFLINELKQKGVKAARVVTGGDDSHLAARRTYEKSGFSTQIPFVQYYMKLFDK
jgi:ribosomal protein S18 acetylase RimI-like enzyme